MLLSGCNYRVAFVPGCGHCKALAPTYEEVATTFANDDDVSAKSSPVGQLPQTPSSFLLCSVLWLSWMLMATGTWLQS